MATMLLSKTLYNSFHTQATAATMQDSFDYQEQF